MDTARWERLCALVEALSGVPDGEREHRLAAAAGDDASLADEARAMLEAERRAGDFLLPPASGAAAAQAASAPMLAPGARVGRYRLLSVLASGGMGTVFLAEQDSPRRTVALKVLRAGLLSADARRRLAFEAEILARLQHPHIAAIHESGVLEAGGLPLPWFALEHVRDALPLDAWCDRRRLGMAGRVRLFLQVVEAVHHAHLRGVVHRDLKPANLLVDGNGRVKVIDFGVARIAGAGEPSGHTTPGQVLGTLQTMSPEQLSGDPGAVDARTDVWALGVVLFELLCGQPPFDTGRGGVAEVARTIAERAPRRPSAWRPELRGDLETVLLRALEKEPARRYASAAAFGDDLLRWLEHRPVEARPPSARHQLRLLARRHRVAAWALLASAAALLLAAGVSLAFGLHWKRAEGEAAAAAGAAREQASRALAAEELAEARAAESEAARAAEAEARARAGVLLERSVDVSLRFLDDLLARVAPLAGRSELTLQLVATLAEHVEWLAEHAGDGGAPVSWRAHLARARGELGKLRARLGQHEEARADLERAVREVLALLVEHPDDLGLLARLADLRMSLGVWLVRSGRPADAVAVLREAEALAVSVLERVPGDLPVTEVLVRTRLNVASALGEAGELAAAAAEREALLAFAREACARWPEDDDLALLLARTLGQRAVDVLAEGQLDEARALRTEEVALLRRVVAARGAAVDARAALAEALDWLAQSCLWLLDGAAAERHATESLALFSRLQDEDPLGADWPRHRAATLFTLGEVERLRAVVEAGTSGERAAAWARAAARYEEALSLYTALHEQGRLPGRDLHSIAEIEEYLAAARAGAEGAAVLP